jgi:aminoglycoside phosphotransferase (APT) family kinase protein
MSLALDAATAAWLADLDPSLEGLPRALQSFSPDAPWSLHDVRWTPGQGCRMAFLDTAGAPRFVAVHVHGDEWDRYDWLDDPALPGLAAAADPAEVGRRLRSVLGETVQVKISPVRYRPGSRGVLRYDAQGASGTSSVFAKALQTESYTRVVALHADLAARPPSSDIVAGMTAGWADLHVVVGHAAGGRSASSALGDASVPDQDRVQLGRELGALLARFHGLNVAAASTWSPDQQLISLADALGAVESADAEMGIRLGAVVDILGASTPPPGDQVLGHGSFRTGQVIVTPEGRTVVLDTDEVRHSDRECDLGTVLAHLTWQGIRQPQNRQTIVRTEHALLDAYEAATGEVRPDALRWWRAAGLVQVAARRYRRLEVRAWPLVRALAAAAEELLADEKPLAAGTDLLDTRQASVVLGQAAGHTVHVDTAELLGTAPGRRSVVRYTVRGLKPEPVTVIGKQFAQARPARLSYFHLHLLADGPFADGPYRVPDPIGMVGGLGLLFYREDSGTRLDTRLDEPGVRNAARWLARLHTSDVRLPRTLSLSREIESAGQWAELIAQAHPPAAADARTLASRWAAAAEASAIDADVPIHKDFHAGHVLVGDQTCVIDLDEARMGDPAFDVAHFCTYLDQYGAPRALVEAFLDEYAAAGGWVDKGSFAPFCAYTDLKIAKQAVAGSGPFRGVAPARRLASAEAALKRGASRLGTSWEGWS